MNFSEFFIRKPVFCIVLSTFILLIGFLSLLDLPLRQYPDTEKSIVTIDTVYPGAASTIVETKITEIIENQISGIEGIKSISSVKVYLAPASKEIIKFSKNLYLIPTTNGIPSVVFFFEILLILPF